MADVGNKPIAASPDIAPPDVASPDIAAALPVVGLSEAEAERVVRTGFWRKVGRAAGRVPFTEDLLAAYFCAFDPDTPFRVRAMLIGALAYFVIPADVLPDIMPLLGFTDDAGIVAATLAAIGTNINAGHRAAARAALGRPARRPGRRTPSPRPPDGASAKGSNFRRL